MNIGELVELLSNVSVDSPAGFVLFVWISKQLQDLNHRVAKVIEKVEDHDHQLNKIHEHLQIK